MYILGRQTPNDVQLYAQMLVYVASQLGVFIIRMSYVYIAYYQSILRGADWMQVTAKKLIQRSNRANHRKCKCITIMSTRDRKICTTLDTGIKYLYKENIYSSDGLRHKQGGNTRTKAQHQRATVLQAKIPVLFIILTP
jgi:hypothetical protein